jgi:hypothetical protein
MSAVRIRTDTVTPLFGINQFDINLSNTLPFTPIPEGGQRSRPLTTLRLEHSPYRLRPVRLALHLFPRPSSLCRSTPRRTPIRPPTPHRHDSGYPPVKLILSGLEAEGRLWLSLFGPCERYTLGMSGLYVFSHLYSVH